MTSEKSVGHNLKTLVDNAIMHEKAFEDGDNKTANRLHKELMSITKALREGHAWNNLKDLARSHENENVKLWAASSLLENDTAFALAVLENLKKSSSVVGISAGNIIDLWNMGLMKFE